ncbi:hypothetical protein ACH4OW_22925 [Streptomyces sp. NPDC017056]|uniref:hypothetical protein n=1 Tax=Streptomyces sp. NPDC017056 TaxID=3364973 RepID=UPI00378F7B03
MSNQYPDPPREQPAAGSYGQPGSGPHEQAGPHPYAQPGPAYGQAGPYGQGGQPGEPGYGYPHAGGAPQGGFPPGAAGAPQGGPMMLSLGDIAVSGDTIMTPAGPMPLKGAVWTATDMSRTEERIPTHAVVLAIVFFLFCLLGLLFLLMKERTTVGHVQVTVNSGGRYHSTMVPVQSPEQVMYVMNQVNYARSLSV